jgi:tetratricopeptide (TPR) repeat protein
MKAALFSGLLMALICSPSWAVHRSDELEDLIKAAREAILEQDYDLAIARCNRAIRLDPNWPVAYLTRAWALDEKGDYDKAIEDCNTALTLRPNKGDESEAYNTRAGVYMDKKEYQKAIKDFHKAIQVDPQRSAAYGELAWLLATCPDDKVRDGKKAWEYAKKAHKLDPEDAAYMDKLAAAFAECGDFEQAVHWEEKAIAGSTRSQVKDVKEWKERLTLYQKKMPYRIK